MKFLYTLLLISMLSSFNIIGMKDVARCNSPALSALWKAIETKDGSQVGALLSNGTLSNTIMGFFGHAPLQRATALNAPDIVQLLIEAGARVNAQNTLGQTALHIAVRESCVEIVHILISAGADDTLQNHEKDSPLDLALELTCIEKNYNQRPIILDMLARRSILRDGILPNPVACKSFNATLLAIINDDMPTIKELGTIVLQPDDFGATPLMYAAVFGKAEIINYLCTLGSDPVAKTT